MFQFIALCCFLCRKSSIGQFKLQVSFSLGCVLWVRVDCRPTSQQIYKRTSSNLIRKGTGCDEYVEDQLNVASKNFAKYLFDDTDGKRYLEDICSMKGWSDKNAILSFFQLLYTPNFILVRPFMEQISFTICIIKQIFGKVFISHIQLVLKIFVTSCPFSD